MATTDSSKLTNKNETQSWN